MVSQRDAMVRIVGINGNGMEMNGSGDGRVKVVMGGYGNVNGSILDGYGSALITGRAKGKEYGRVWVRYGGVWVGM